MASAHRPGTLAAARPEPRLVTSARRSIDEGNDVDSTARTIADEASGPEEVKRAGIYFQQRMGKVRAGDDGYRSNRVQMALEAAYAVLRSHPDSTSTDPTR
ncbi:MAG TPA: hypothetical protein VMP13_00675 [Acidimicrobiia bacterium]|nr:hypothetical protein [Acidimicrobiia bacterium]